MSDGQLNGIHDRELAERRRATLYFFALAGAALAVIVALAIALVAVAHAVG